jgi:septal ring factor EnvC (AmiA/AmiB activator)
MKTYAQPLLLLSSVLFMGIAMPSCPAQQAMQQQIDTLQTSNVDTAKKLKQLQTDLTSLSTEMAQVKQLLPQMTSVIQAQKAEMEQIASELKNLHSNKTSKTLAKPMAKPMAAKPAMGGAKRHR